MPRLISVPELLSVRTLYSGQSYSYRCTIIQSEAHSTRPDVASSRLPKFAGNQQSMQPSLLRQSLSGSFRRNLCLLMQKSARSWWPILAPVPLPLLPG